MLKLFIFACIAQIPFWLFLSTFTDSFALNIFFTFFLALFALFIYDKTKHKILGFLFTIFISVVANLIPVDYGYFGILLVFCFYYFKDRKWQMTLSTIILCSIYYVLKILAYPNMFFPYLWCIFFTCLSLCFILLYNNKEGPKSKYFFYIFYPLHLTLLYFLHMALYS